MTARDWLIAALVALPLILAPSIVAIVQTMRLRRERLQRATCERALVVLRLADDVEAIRRAIRFRQMMALAGHLQFPGRSSDVDGAPPEEGAVGPQKG